MNIDGRAIAHDIYRELVEQVAPRKRKPHLTVFTCAPNFETQKYLALKRKKAAEVGIEVNVIEFPENVTTEEVLLTFTALGARTNGLIVQLPFPPQVRIDEVLARIPHSLDVDGLHYDGTSEEILPPVVGAIDEIVARYRIALSGKRVVVVGDGRLVGRPAAHYARARGAEVTVITKGDPNAAAALRAADVLVLGAGSPHMVSPDEVKDGVVIFDAGTSESAGVLVGDADPACAEKAALFTPVPGGIGPITVAILLRNLVRLAS